MITDVQDRKRYSVDLAYMEILGTFIGENVTKSLPKSDSGRTLIVGWLIFAFIIGTGYSGNLKANLTLPKYPPRIETVDELVESVDM